MLAKWQIIPGSATMNEVRSRGTTSETIMNPTSKRTNEDLQIASRHNQMRCETLRPEQLAHERLIQLQTFISQLSKTPHGRNELRCRKKLFGECNPLSGESVGHYYGRLRQWIDGSVAQSRMDS
jgi:hypothetical protein